jgi:hypothetical protein
MHAIGFLDIKRKEGGIHLHTHLDNRKMITMTRLVQNTTGTDRLSRHFSKQFFDDYCNKTFGGIQYLCPIILSMHLT